MDRRLRAVGLALLAAVLYAVNLPFSKLLLGQVGSLTMAGLLYLGAGVVWPCYPSSTGTTLPGWDGRTWRRPWG